MGLIHHRIRSHRAALRAAEALGHPDALADAVRDTTVRLDECLDILGALSAEAETVEPGDRMAQAWDAGYTAGWDDEDGLQHGGARTANPYREQR